VSWQSFCDPMTCCGTKIAARLAVPDARVAMVRQVGRQGKGDAIQIGEAVELAIREFQRRHPA
jgi:hypothetical protein